MNKNEIRQAVFEILRKSPQTHFRAVENDLRRRSEDYERRDVLALNEVLWALLVQGVLAPGKNSLNPDLPFVHVTEYGAQCLEQGAILAHDPDGYVERLRSVTGGCAAPVVLESAREGLLSLLDGRHAAALLLLSHAVEHVVNELRDGLIRSGRRTGRGTKRLEAKRGIPGGRTSPLLRALLARRPPPEIVETAEANLSGMEAVNRLVRTKDGAPCVPSADHDLTLARFLLFPDQCRFAYHAIGWLDAESRD